MQDRVPTYPGRVTLTPVAGKANTYDMARADEPTQAGTPLNKATLLKDTTAALFGLGSDAVPDEVLKVLSQAALYKTVTPTAQLGTLPVGTTIYLNESGVPVPYIIVNQGIPGNSPLYDESCNGTWVLRRDIYENAVWDSDNSNVLPGADIFATMAGMLSLYDADVQAAIKTVKIPYCVGGGSTTVNSGSNGLECQIFPLGIYELGWTSSDNSSFVADGIKLDYFTSGTTSDSNEKRIANFMEVPTVWWTRQPVSSNSVWNVQPDGSNSNAPASYERGVRPCFVLPATFLATTSLPITSLYDLSNNLLLTLPVVQIETGSYVGTGTYGSSNPNMLTFGFTPKLFIVRVQSLFVIFNFPSDGSYTTPGYFYPNGADSLSPNSTASKASGNTVAWYGTASQDEQLNMSGVTYTYFALG